MVFVIHWHESHKGENCLEAMLGGGEKPSQRCIPKQPHIILILSNTSHYCSPAAYTRRISLVQCKFFQGSDSWLSLGLWHLFKEHYICSVESLLRFKAAKMDPVLYQDVWGLPSISLCSAWGWGWAEADCSPDSSQILPEFHYGLHLRGKKS